MASQSASNLSVAPATGYTVDITPAFLEHMGNRNFENMHELAHYLRQFQNVTGSYYSIRTSKTGLDGLKKFIKYQCIRRGFRKHPSEGIRERQLDHTNCPASFNISRRDAIYRVTSSQMVHNHELLEGEASRWFVRNRRLEPSELEIIRPLLDCRDRSYNIRYYVRTQFNKYLTNSDVCNLRARHFFGRNNPGK